MAYKPIESYGVIGDLHTVALVGMDGSIDWCCLPHFDSPSIFAAILDEHKGGFFKIASLYDAQHKQMYLPDSNVLVTRFLSPAGVGEVIDFMPVQERGLGKKTHQIVRVVRAVRGAVRFRLECQPAFDYARRPHQIPLEGRGAVFEAPGMRFSLVSRFPLARQGTGVVTEFLLHPGEPSTFILRQVEGDGDAGLMEARLVGTELLTQTLEFWRRWLSKCRYDGRWREMVNRSALVLKLLTFAPTGAIVAAPTCSIPEEIGGGGYRGSRPVRVGNGACEQLQLDIYGELMDSVYLYDKYGSPMAYDSWGHVRRVIDWVADNWMKPDDGIWEVRGGQQQFIYSKVQCWVALDRAIRLATKRSLPLDRARLLAERDRIYEAVMTHGWDAERRTFVQYFGTDALDAANLIMPLVFFISPTDPRMIGTINRTMAELVSDSLVYRYEMGKGAGDGLTGGEGTFNMCTFWLVEALTRARRLEEARFIFEKMLTYANHLGLYAEETGPSGEALGNFPQAFTHMGLISAAFNLDRRLEGAA